MIVKTFKSILVVAAAGLIAVGCLARGGTVDNFQEDAYEQALERFSGQTSAIDEGVASFSAGYGDLTQDELAARIRELYAPDLYFNDTIHTFNDRDALVDYLVRTGESLEESRVEVRQVIRDGADVFLRWSMEFRTSAAGKDIHSQSIGMTHLRFDEQGRVVLHQDFWDSGHALYAHLPIVGFFVRRAHNRL